MVAHLLWEQEVGGSNPPSPTHGLPAASIRAATTLCAIMLFSDEPLDGSRDSGIPGRGIPDSGLRGSRSRLGQLLALLGLTGFAISQPILAVAGEDPSLFTFAGLRGSELVVLALSVALVPPLVLWTVVVVVGWSHRRAGDVVFVVIAALLAGAAVSQWAWSAGLDRRWARGAVWLLVAIGFGALLVRVGLVAVWTRYTAFLPLLAVGLFLTASPTSALLSSPADPVTPRIRHLPADRVPADGRYALHRCSRHHHVAVDELPAPDAAPPAVGPHA